MKGQLKLLLRIFTMKRDIEIEHRNRAQSRNDDPKKVGFISGARSETEKYHETRGQCYNEITELLKEVLNDAADRPEVNS